MPGLSTKPKLNIQATKFFEKIGVIKILEIDVTKLSSLQAVLDGKAHASIIPSDNYLKKNNMSMLKAIEDWNAKGNDHALSKELSNSVKCT